MQKLLDNQITLLVFRLLIGAIFVFFGISKIANPLTFANEIGNYDLLPSIIVHFSSIFLPWIELIVGLFLISGIKVKENALISFILLGVFTLAVLIAYARGLDINCGCSGGDAQEKVGFKKIAENLILMAITMNLIITNHKKYNLMTLINKNELI